MGNIIPEVQMIWIAGWLNIKMVKVQILLKNIYLLS